MLSVTRGIILTGVSLLLAGCAQFSPQQIKFQPAIDPNNVPSGTDTTVTVVVEDRRSGSEIGVRGGAYANSSIISASGDLRGTLQQLSEKVLERAGYNLVELGGKVQLTFALEELSYQVVSIDAARKEATGAARFSVQAVGSDAIYSNSFRAQRTIETLRYPSEEENSELMNYVFDAALERLFGDPELEKFLNLSR